MDEPCSALDPISTLAIEDLMGELKRTHDRHRDPQHAAGRARERSDRVLQPRRRGQPGQLVEINDTETMFTQPAKRETEDYISGSFRLRISFEGWRQVSKGHRTS